ncbi:MAG: cytochrome c oxidase accessory protein CcoG [Spirochaetia bacterium]|nr:cytochrome c oxidase accessory protein CcoG [Spirochaetia bacterium]
MVIARPVKGKHRSIKTRISYILFSIFFIFPFIKIGGKQSLFFDIPNRKFHVFGLTIWPQEFYFLHLLLIMAGVLLFLITALYGRLWCGYACPQTLFTEVYNLVGRLIGGKKFGKRSETISIKIRVNIAWFLISIFFSLFFITYFKGLDETWLALINYDFYEKDGSFQTWIIFLAAFTFTAFGNMAWFREDMCRLVCPYGRFQTALLDSHSPIVYYDKVRGEPRRQKGEKEGKGDCTSCNMCIAVCPTGIDIKDGLQVGCIACGLCVDACTIEMQKHNKITLNDYRTIEQIDNTNAKRHYIRPRTIVYGSFLTVLITIFSYFLIIRTNLYAFSVRDSSIYQMLIPNYGVQNGYYINVGNKTDFSLKVKIELDSKSNPIKILNLEPFYEIDPGGYMKIRLILLYESKEKSFADKKLIPIKFSVIDINNKNNKNIFKSVFSFPGE